MSLGDTIDLDAIQTKLTSAFAAYCPLGTVTLRDATTFQVRVSDGYRRSEGITAGSDQQVHRLRVLADEWDAASPGRTPEKGDRIQVNGKTHAIRNSVHVRGLSGTSLMYVMEVAG